MTGSVTTEALREALAYLKPHETNGGTISLKAPKAREAVAVIEAALQQVTAERDEARAKLRSACLDALAAQDQAAENDERARAAEASLATASSELARLRAEGEAKDRRIALADRVKAQLEVAQNALVKIDRGGKPMREIAARGLLDIAMVPYPEEAAAFACVAKEEQADA